MRITHIEIVYYKASGKYYSSGELDLEGEWEFWKAIEHIKKNYIDIGKRPGLVDGDDYHWLITVYTEFGPLTWLYINEAYIEVMK